MARLLLAARGKSHPCRRADLSGQLFVGETHRIYHGFASFRRLDLTRNFALPAAEHFRHGLLGAIFLLWATFLGGCNGPNTRPAPVNTGSSTKPAGEARDTPAAAAPAAAPAGFATREALVEARVAALRKKDREALANTLHPASRAAINQETEPLFERLLVSELSKPLSDTYEVKYAPYELNDPSVIHGDFSYPVEPVEEASVRFEPTYHSYITLIWPIAPDQGRWYVVAPVPTAQLLGRLAADRDRKEQFRPRARELAADLKDPLRAELVGYVQEGRTEAAARRYRQEFQVSMEDAKLVIQALEESLKN
jgi:hypothetical protein